MYWSRSPGTLQSGIVVFGPGKVAEFQVLDVRRSHFDVLRQCLIFLASDQGSHQSGCLVVIRDNAQALHETKKSLHGSDDAAEIDLGSPCS